MSDICIISDDCFGVGVYQTLKLQYNTPFISTFIQTPDYIKLLSNLDYYLNLKLEQISFQESNYNNIYRLNDRIDRIYSKLGDIEVIFFHCTDNNTIIFDNWYRRRDRMFKNKDKIIVKLGNMQVPDGNTGDSNRAKEIVKYNNFNQLLDEFYKLPNFKKITITKEKYKHHNNFVMLPNHTTNRLVMGQEFNRYLDILKFAK